jgi:hypothetical protein
LDHDKFLFKLKLIIKCNNDIAEKKANANFLHSVGPENQSVPSDLQMVNEVQDFE